MHHFKALCLRLMKSEAEPSYYEQPPAYCTALGISIWELLPANLHFYLCTLVCLRLHFQKFPACPEKYACDKSCKYPLKEIPALGCLYLYLFLVSTAEIEC